MAKRIFKAMRRLLRFNCLWGSPEMTELVQHHFNEEESNQGCGI